MKRIVLFLLCCCCLSAKAVTIEEANLAYKNGEFANAATLYEQLLETGSAPELHYNLGNAYFKQNEIGKSILNYERALRLRSFYEDAKYNLSIARERIVDNVEDTQNSFLIVWTNSLINLLNSNVWAYISITCLVLAAVCFLLFAFSQRLTARKIAFHLTWIAFVVCITTGVFSGISYHRYTERAAAIVMQGVATVKSAPDRSGTDLFILHEGTKVMIKDKLGDWNEIILPNGGRGWIESAMVERI